MNEPTRRQLAALSFVMLLSPATRLLPGAAARLGGALGWLSPLLAAPAGALIALLVNRAMRRCAPGEGLGGLLLRAYPRLGRALLALCGLWLTFYAGFAVRSAASRFIYTIYTGAPPRFFVIAGLGAGLLAALGGIKRLARAAEIFRPLLLAALVPMLALSLTELNPGALISAPDVPGLLEGAAEAVGTLGFANEYVPGRGRALALWSLRESLLFALVTAAVIGRFGAAAAGAMTYPFFALVRNTGLFGVAERIEALVTALWVLSDFVLAALSLMAAARALRLALGLKRERRLAVLCALAALAAAWACAPDALALRYVSEVLVVRGNLAVLALLLAASAAAARRTGPR